MSETSGKSSPKTCEDSPACICSPASPAGTSPSTSRDGETAVDLFGQPHAPARPSASPASNASARSARERTLSGALDELVSRFAPTAGTPGMPTSGTYGRKYGDSPRSAALQESMESRLRASLVGSGSPLYRHRWKSAHTLLARPIFQLQASARRISGSEFSGWPSPMQADGKRSGVMLRGNPSLSSAAASIAGWGTPRASDADRNVRTGPGADREAARKGANKRSRGRRRRWSRVGRRRPRGTGRTRRAWRRRAETRTARRGRESTSFPGRHTWPGGRHRTRRIGGTGRRCGRDAEGARARVASEGTSEGRFLDATRPLGESGPWDDAILIPCRDGKTPTRPSA